MKFGDPMKLIVVALLLACLGFAIYNGMNSYRLFKGEGSERIDEARTKMQLLKRVREEIKLDLKRINAGKIVDIGRVTSVFRKQAEFAGIGIGRSGVTIKSTAKTKPGKLFNEDSWDIGFQDRKKKFTLQQIVKFANRIESQAPGFQIKALDAGQRKAPWGKDEWVPNKVTVRRIYRKKSKK